MLIPSRSLTHHRPMPRFRAFLATQVTLVTVICTQLWIIWRYCMIWSIIWRDWWNSEITEPQDFLAYQSVGCTGRCSCSMQCWLAPPVTDNFKSPTITGQMNITGLDLDQMHWHRAVFWTTRTELSSSSLMLWANVNPNLVWLVSWNWSCTFALTFMPTCKSTV